MKAEKYVKKPIKIKAIKFDGSSECLFYIKEWVGKCFLKCKENPLTGHWTFVIKTLEGEFNCRPGDYIIKGVAGEFYPCKESVFLKTYKK